MSDERIRDHVFVPGPGRAKRECGHVIGTIPDVLDGTPEPLTCDRPIEEHMLIASDWTPEDTAFANDALVDAALAHAPQPSPEAESEREKRIRDVVMRRCQPEHRGRGIGWACAECIGDALDNLSAALAKAQADMARTERVVVAARARFEVWTEQTYADLAQAFRDYDSARAAAESPEEKR